MKTERAPAQLAAHYANRTWKPDNPTARRIKSLMYYAYLAGYRRAKREARNA